MSPIARFLAFFYRRSACSQAGKSSALSDFALTLTLPNEETPPGNESGRSLTARGVSTVARYYAFTQTPRGVEDLASTRRVTKRLNTSGSNEPNSITRERRSV